MSRGRTWARHLGVSLVRVDDLELDRFPGLEQALRDGVDRAGPGDRPELPAGCERFQIRVGTRVVGLLAIERDCPDSGLATVIAVAIDPGERGRAVGTKALLAAERRLRREGIYDVRTRVPRSNGRGLYFMLRAGFTPAPEAPADGATWFARQRPSSARYSLRARRAST